MLIYPAVDLRGGVCVRLLQGRFDAVTRYDEDPRARLEAFAAAGAQWVHIVDLDGAEAGAPVQHGLIGELVKATGLKVQTGGGVRSRDDVARLLDAGVSAVVVGSRAISAPGEVAGWLREFGSDRVTLALDVRIEDGAPEVATHGWVKGSGVDLWSALDALSDGAPKRVLVTDVARDGALGGPNLDLMAEIVQRRPDIELQASGGVGKPEDIAALKATGAQSAIVGKAIYEGLVDLGQAISDAG